MDGHDLLGAYALDAVDDHDRSAFEQHLAACDACWTELPSLMSAARRVASVRPRSA